MGRRIRKTDRSRELLAFPEGERAVLGGLLTEKHENQGLIFKIVDNYLSAEDFYREAHRHIYRAIAAQCEVGEPADPVTLTAALARSDVLELCGGISYLVGLVDAVPSTVNIRHYAKHVKEKAILRRADDATITLQDRFYTDQADLTAILSDGIEALVELRRSAQDPDDLSSTQLITPLIHQIVERASSGLKEDQEGWLYSGLVDLDKLIGGFSPGNLIVIAARPQQGKTALATDIAWHNAKRGITAAYYTFEMTSQEIARRFAAKESKIDLLKLKTNDLDTEELARLTEKFRDNKSIPLIIDEQNVVPAQIEERISRYNDRFPEAPVKAIFVDHLQIMGVNDSRHYDRRDLQLATYTGQLKHLAKYLGVPIFLLSQLNRQSDVRQAGDRLPKLSDLRESGAIEADADVVIGIYRRYVDSKKSDNLYDAEIGVIKNRDGPIGHFKPIWMAEYASFVDQDHTGRPEPVKLDKPIF